MIPALVKLEYVDGEGGRGCSYWPFGIPPTSDDVNLMLVPAVMPELRRVASSANALPLNMRWMSCGGMDVLRQILCLSIAKVESG